MKKKDFLYIIQWIILVQNFLILHASYFLHSQHFDRKSVKKPMTAKGARGQKTYFGNQSCAMFWQQTIGHIAMLITNGSNYVFRLFSHLIQKQIHNTKTSFSDMSSFFWAEFVCNLGKMTAYEWKGNNVTILGREFQAHLEMVLKKSGIKAKQWQVWCVY